jgi:hypothetical protein
MSISVILPAERRTCTTIGPRYPCPVPSYTSTGSSSGAVTLLPPKMAHPAIPIKNSNKTKTYLMIHSSISYIRLVRGNCISQEVFFYKIIRLKRRISGHRPAKFAFSSILYYIDLQWRKIMELQYTYWQDGQFFVGFLNDYPDDSTQGVSLAELEESLIEVYEIKQEEKKHLAGIRKTGKIKIPA